MNKELKFVFLSIVIVSLLMFSGCADMLTDDDSQDESSSVFDNYVADYREVLSKMRVQLNDHQSEASSCGMSGIGSMMDRYFSEMKGHMEQLRHDLDGIHEYCYNNGWHHDHDFWEDMEQFHQDCWDEVYDHFDDMQHCHDFQDVNNEMNEHMTLMWQFMEYFEECHEWMENHDHDDHHDDEEHNNFCHD